MSDDYEPLKIKEGDRFPDVEIIVRDENGAIVDLTDATATFSLRKAREPGAIVIADADAVVTNPGGGGLAYQWQSGDDLEPGTYEGEFYVTPSAGNGDPFHCPTEGYIVVVVEERVNP